MIYVDHNATTPLDPSVLERMLPYLRGDFGNASSVHAFGQQARRGVDRARAQVAAALGCLPVEIVFTSGGTEADNLAVVGAFEAAAGGHIVTTAVEHPAVLAACALVEARGGRVTIVGVDEWGAVSPAAVEAALADDTALVSIMLANNDVGTLQPVREVAALARARGVLVHTDAVQGLGKLRVDVDDLGVDLLSLSAHKVYGPKGAGALFVRRGVSLAPQLVGGDHELSRRAGTENVAAIVGLGAACERLGELVDGAAAVAKKRDRLEALLVDGGSDARVNGHPTARLPNTLNVTFAAVEGEALNINLDLMGIAASVGSACASGKVDPSHVLAAMGHDVDTARGSVRFSLGHGTTSEEVEAVASAVIDIASRLRGLDERAMGQW